MQFMKSRIQIWGFLYIILNVVLLQAQTPFYINYDTNNGLPSPEVYNIYFTDDNKAWFTTDRGIANYNGYEFTTYSTEDGLSTNTNFNIFEDSKHRLWFTGIDGSISILNNGQFLNEPFLDSLKNISIKRFYFKPTENSQGQVLIFTRFQDFCNKIFMIYDLKNNSLEKFTAEEFEAKYCIQNGPSINIIKFGETYLPFSNEILFYKPLVKHFEHLIGTSKNQIYKIDKKGEIVQTTRINDNTDFCYVDSANDLWVGTNNGLYLYNNADLNSSPKHYFPTVNITDLKEDFEENYWISTGDQGVFFIPDPKINTNNLKNKYFNNARILSIGALEQRIYFGSYLGKIFSIDKNYKVDTIFNAINDANKKNYYNAFKLENKIYFLDQYVEEEKNGNVGLYSNKTFSQNFVSIQLSDGELFSFKGNRYCHHKKDTLACFPIKSDPLYTPRIECVAEDREGKIWIGAHDGLHFMKFQNNNTATKPLFYNTDITHRINDIKLDLHGNLWIGSVGNGLIYKTPDSTYHIKTQDGLQSNLINCIFIQDSTTAWIGTNQGLNLIKYEYKNNILTINDNYGYGVLDGLLSNFINDISYWNGYIWLATNKGIVYIKPESLKTYSPLVPIHLEHFKVNDRVRIPENGISLTAEENDIFLQMTGISYRKEDTNEFYRYRLSESNDISDWSYTSERNIQFIDLPPGSYIFEAAAQNKSKEWSEHPIHLEFKIEPYFTQTLLFKILLAGFILSIFIILFIVRDIQLKRKNKLQQRFLEVKMKAKEYELSALRNQINPHFVFNSLNAIQSFIFKNDKIKANYFLSKFSRLMRDSLHFSRLKYIGLNKEIRFLETYLELEQMRFPDAFDFSIEIDDDVPIKQYAIPSLLFQPVLENVVKHAFKGLEYKGFIDIKIKDKIPGHSLSVVIQDNGNGFKGDFFAINDASNSYKSLGLTIVKNQIDALNLETAEEVASFTILNLADDNMGTVGVKASFVIPVKSMLSRIPNIEIV